MKLYDYEGAPNPRRVRMFAAEKDMQLESVQVNIRAGEQRSTPVGAGWPGSREVIGDQRQVIYPKLWRCTGP